MPASSTGLLMCSVKWTVISISFNSLQRSKHPGASLHKKDGDRIIPAAKPERHVGHGHLCPRRIACVVNPVGGGLAGGTIGFSTTRAAPLSEAIGSLLSVGGAIARTERGAIARTKGGRLPVDNFHRPPATSQTRSRNDELRNRRRRGQQPQPAPDRLHPGTPVDRLHRRQCLHGLAPEVFHVPVLAKLRL